jgi:serine protease Do
MTLSLQQRRTLIVILISAFVGAISGGAAAIMATSVFPEIINPWVEKNILHRSSLTSRHVGTLAVEEESATVDAVRKVSPSVVSIVISKELRRGSDGSEFFPFEEFFGFGLPEPDGSSLLERQQVGGGSGFIISSDGLILTNRHVVADPAAQYTVITNDGTRYGAEVVAADTLLDIAIVKINASNLPVAELGDSDSLKIGQTVIAVGFALGEFRNTVTKGVVSGINRQVTAGGPSGEAEIIDEAIQTDAAINPGNSGGPLVNLAGQVIGVNTAISEEGQLVGFAIPANAAKQIIESIRTTGKIVRPWLGVRYVLLDQEIARANQLPVNYGALVVSGSRITDLAVAPGSPADKAGFKENDIILEVGGVRIDEAHPLARLIAKHKPGDAVVFQVLRKGNTLSLTATLEERKQ